jgi:hypothetical protein
MAQQVNPAAVLKSLQEQYRYLIATGVTDPAAFEQLQGTMDSFVRQWEQELAAGTGIRGFGTDAAQDFITYGKEIGRQIGNTAQNMDLAGLDRARDSYMSPTSAEDQAYLEELYGRVSRGEVSTDEAIKLVEGSGRFNTNAGTIVSNLIAMGGLLTQEQMARLNAGMDPLTGEGAGETGIGTPGDSDFKPFEPVANDITSPEDEFQKAFSQFTRQLETSLGGKAPQIAALSNKYQDLFNSYLGEIEQRKTRGEEGERVFKADFQNVGKSTDSQFDQKTDRMALKTNMPKLSPFDFLVQNVDPEDVLASTPFEDRPGRSTGGYTGFVKRLNR